MGTNLRDGNVGKMGVIKVSLDVPSVAANTTAAGSFNVRGLRPGDMVFVAKPSVSTGLGIVNCFVSNVNILTITFCNVTAAPINPPAQDYQLIWFRPDNPESLPAAVQV